MDTGTITGLLTAGGSVLLLLLGWGLKIGGQHWSFLKNQEVRRLIYDVVKGQVRTTMPGVVLGMSNRTGGISKTQAKKQVITGTLGILGPLAKEFTKMSAGTQEAIVNSAVHSIKKEMGLNTTSSRKSN